MRPVRKFLIPFIFAFFFLGSGPVFSADAKAVTIAGFENTTKNTGWGWLSRGLPDMLSTGISQSYDIRIVEREAIQKLLEEQKLALAGLADEKTAIRIGKLLNAQLLIRGGFIVQNGLIRIDARIINTETSELKSVQETGRSSELFDMVQKLVEKITLQILLKAPDAYSPETRSFDALKSYYEGLEFLDSKDTGKAIEKFQQSSAFDPFYTRPQKGLEEAYQFLKDFRNFRCQRELNELFRKLDRFKKRAEEKPFLTYAELVQKSGWAAMSDNERKAFNKKNESAILAQSPAQGTWHAMITLLEIYDKKYDMMNERLNAIDNQFSEKENALRKKHRKEKSVIHARKMEILTNKSLFTNNTQRNAARKKLNSENDALDKAQDIEEKAMDGEENSVRSSREKEEADFFKRNSFYLEEMVRMAGKARKDYQGDDFLPEILYMELLALSQLKDYQRLKTFSESYLLDYPSFRMIEAVEDFYKTALDKLKEIK